MPLAGHKYDINISMIVMHRISLIHKKMVHSCARKYKLADKYKRKEMTMMCIEVSLPPRVNMIPRF
jgi:hypothetical protein